MYFIVAAILAVAPVVDSSCEECKRFTKSCVSGAAVYTGPAKKITRERIRIKGRFKKGGCCG
jgi:hypothetical protein